MSEERPKGVRLAEALDAVRWDYDPEDDRLSPLVSTERYFRDFPWEPEDVFVDCVEGQLDLGIEGKESVVLGQTRD